MDNGNILWLGILFLLYSNGSISLTQALLLLALGTTTSCPCCSCNDTTQNVI